MISHEQHVIIIKRRDSLVIELNVVPIDEISDLGIDSPISLLRIGDIEIGEIGGFGSVGQEIMLDG